MTSTPPADAPAPATAAAPSTADAAPAAPAPGAPVSRRDRWRYPPGWLFDVIVVLPLLALLYSRSFPGSAYHLTFAAGIVLVLLGIIWAVRLAGFLSGRRVRGGGLPAVAPGTAEWPFLVPVVLTVIAGVLFFTAVPLQLRWSAAKSAFDHQVDKVHAVPATAGMPTSLSGPHTVGSYDITHVYRLGANVRFDEKTGDFLASAGFAYLPQGPTPQVHHWFTKPSFRSLGSHWYAWVDKTG